MAANQESVSFDEIVQAARKRRKQQNLTDKFFSKNRGPGASGSQASSRRESPARGSLANRVEKPSASAGVQKKLGKAAPVGTSRPKSANARGTRESRMLSSHLPSPSARTVRESQSDFNIRGRASAPCVVIGSNFAPGTTAADIQSALESVGGTMINCRIVSSHPTVVAEMTFADQRGAESVVATFNNQTADGRTLHIRIKQPPIGVVQSQTSSSFDTMREQADRERRESRGADPQIQDGRYGFGDSRRRGRDYANGTSSRNGGLYSDNMMVDEPITDSHSRNRRNR